MMLEDRLHEDRVSHLAGAYPKTPGRSYAKPIWITVGIIIALVLLLSGVLIPLLGLMLMCCAIGSIREHSRPQQ